MHWHLASCHFPKSSTSHLQLTVAIRSGYKQLLRGSSPMLSSYWGSKPDCSDGTQQPRRRSVTKCFLKRLKINTSNLEVCVCLHVLLNVKYRHNQVMKLLFMNFSFTRNAWSLKQHFKQISLSGLFTVGRAHLQNLFLLKVWHWEYVKSYQCSTIKDWKPRING